MKSYTPIIEGEPNPLVVPEIVAFGITSTVVRIDWAGAATDVTAFKLFRRTGEEDFAEIAEIDNLITTYDDEGLEPSTEYTYRLTVVLVDGENTYESGYSNESTATTADFDPAILSAVELSSSRVSLAWAFYADPELGEITFNIMRQGEGEFELLESVEYTQDDNTYEDTGLPADTAYTYRIDAVRGETTLESNEETVTTQEISLSATASEEVLAIDLIWSVNCDDNTEWAIGRSTVEGGPYTTIETLALENTTHSDTTVAAETEYFYIVTPIAEGLELGTSNEASATSPEEEPGGGGGEPGYLGTIRTPAFIGYATGYVTDIAENIALDGDILTLTNGSSAITRSVGGFTEADIGAFIFLQTEGYAGIPVAAIRSVEDGNNATLSRDWPDATIAVESDGGTINFWKTKKANATVGLIDYDENAIRTFTAPIPYFTHNNRILRCGANRFAIISSHASGCLTVIVYNDILDDSLCIPQGVIIKIGLNGTSTQIISPPWYSALTSSLLKPPMAWHLSEGANDYICVAWKPGSHLDAVSKYCAKFNIDTFEFEDLFDQNTGENLGFGCDAPAKGVLPLCDRNVGLWNLLSGAIGGDQGTPPEHVNGGDGTIWDTMAGFYIPLSTGEFATIGQRHQDTWYTETFLGWVIDTSPGKVNESYGILEGDSTDLSYALDVGYPTPEAFDDLNGLTSASGTGTYILSGLGGIGFEDLAVANTTRFYDVYPAPDNTYIGWARGFGGQDVKAYLLDSNLDPIVEITGALQRNLVSYCRDPEGILSELVWSP